MTNTPTTNIHDLNAILFGTGEFSFSEDATSAAEARSKGYRDFGNVTKITLAPDVQTTEHLGSYRGKRIVDKTFITQSKFQYTVSFDELSQDKMKFAILGEFRPDFTQAALAGVAGQAIAFSTASPSQSSHWYDIFSASGAPLMFLDDVLFDGLEEGVDFELDLRLSRVRFLTPQTAPIVPTITASAIAAGQGFKATAPLSKTSFKGFGRLSIFDDTNPNKVVFDHRDFSCEISFNAIGDIDGQSPSELTIDILVTGTPGVVYQAY